MASQPAQLPSHPPLRSWLATSSRIRCTIQTQFPNSSVQLERVKKCCVRKARILVLEL